MDQGYNLDNLEASFREYLVAGNVKPVSIKNYLSDLRHFLGWLIFYVRANFNSPENRAIRESPLQLITVETIEKYKNYLQENNIPIKTINRRLSTVRKFCSFCIAQGWIKENPAKKISNIKYQILKNINTEILEKFEKDLQKEKLDQPTIKSYLDDVQEFLSV